MERPFELYIFDWDGTCMDTTDAIARSIQNASVAMGFKKPSYAVASSVIGLGHEDMMRIAVPECPREDYGKYAEFYWDFYRERESLITGLHPGMKELLQNMKTAKLWMAIGTGKSRKGIRRVTAKTGVADLFVASRTMDESPSKPNPQMILDLADECCVDLNRVVMIGDAVHDLQMAANAGVASVGVTWGAADRKTLEGLNPIAVVDTAEELAAAIGVSDLL